MTVKGEPILYVKLNKALYSLLRSALLWYKKLRAELEKMGFMVNPYDPCVANREVNGSQMTVTWHINDLKISAKDKNKVTKFVLHTAKTYGPNTIVSRGETRLPRNGPGFLHQGGDEGLHDQVLEENNCRLPRRSEGDL